MKKVLIFIISSLLIIINCAGLYANASYNSSVDFQYSNIVLLESLDNGTVLFDKNSNTKTAPASLTKIVTAMVVLNHCKDMDKVITAPTDVIRSLDGLDSSSAGIVAGEDLTVEQLLQCMLIKSACEASEILADYVGGGNVDKFVKMMNTYVKDLGCKNTHFKNPSGLDEDGQYTTASDLALITKAALKNKTFVEISNTTKFTVPVTNKNAKERPYNTTNLLISPHSIYYYEYASGVKTGTTDEAGRCLISTAKKNGYTYLAIVMQAQEIDTNGDGKLDNHVFIDSKNAYDWVFKNIKLKTVADPNMIVSSVKVNLSGKADSVNLVPQKTVSSLVPANIDSSSVSIEPIKSSLQDHINAPVKKGEVYGKAVIKYAGQEIGTVNLVAANKVSRSPMLYLGYLIKTLSKSLIFRIIIIILLLMLIFYIAISLLYGKKIKHKTIYMVKNDESRSSRNIRR